jgi:hypothetical protein
MLLNFLLMREGWPPALYPVTDRAQYMRAIRSARMEKDLDPMIRATAEAAQFLIDRYLHAIGQVREGERELARHIRDKDRGLAR